MYRLYHSLRFSFLILILCSGFVSIYNNANAQVCLPTCGNDARFLVFAGENLATQIQSNLNFGLASSDGMPQLNFGFFDAEAGGLWDDQSGDGLIITLYADPLADGSGNFKVGTWFSDGSDGLNAGMPMPDNDWFDISIDNVPEAQAESGHYMYRLEVENRDAAAEVLNAFKLRTDESLFIFNEQPFAFNASLFGEGAAVLDVISTVYPDFSFEPIGDPNCFTDAFNICDIDNPMCCLHNTIYDGFFNIFLLFEEDSVQLDFWEADADFGTVLATEDPPYEDTDDLNTPGDPFLPQWANLDTTNFETSAGAQPTDDQPFIIFLRPGNVTYDLISPLGDIYTNSNPSATNEWELFQLNTEPGCAPFLCDIEVPAVPQGIWTARFKNLDLSNSVFLRLSGAVVGVDEIGDPVPPLDPDPDPEPPVPPMPEVVVPTMSEWGLLATVLFLGISGLYFIKRRKTETENN